MIIKDKIYGTHHIVSPVLLELITSAPFQRLTKINQYGIPDRYYYVKGYSRYDHCIGVMLILKILGASEEEQIAGLLHDISHTAFSHVIDWAIGDHRKEDFQDSSHTKYLKKSGVDKILKKYGYSVDRISDYHHFTLLEQEAPDICADRVDYSLRDFFTPPSVRNLWKKIANINGRMVFKDKKSATIFAKNFLEVQKKHWSGFEGVSRYVILSEILKYAFDKKLLSLKDIWQDDEWVIAKMLKTNDPFIMKGFVLLKKRSLINLPKRSISLAKKFRYVDPKFIQSSSIKKVTQVDRAFKQQVDEAREVNAKGIYAPKIV